MRNEDQGAKAARLVIKRFQAHINSPRLVPDQCYRMASKTFSLVCYVNQVTGLYLSKNYAVIPIFLRRAHEQLVMVHSERVSEPYRQLVLQYLSHVAHFIVEYSCLSDDEEHNANLIPQELLDIIPGPLPEDLVLQGEF
jgi:hypothetical protein